MIRSIGMILNGKLASAGLFAALAILTLSFTVSTPSYPSILYGPTTITTLWLSPRYLLFTIILASAVSALIYCVLAHWPSPSLNRSLILVQFVFLAIALFTAAEAVRGLASALLDARQAGSTVYIVWHSPLVLVGFTSVALGSVIFLVNLGMAAIKHFHY